MSGWDELTPVSPYEEDSKTRFVNHLLIRGIFPSCLKGKLEQQDPETQAHTAAVTNARICKCSCGWLRSLKGLPAVDVDIDIWVISSPRTKLQASDSPRVLHDSENTLGHIWHRGKTRGKMFNHLSGFLPSWDEQYRVTSVHGPRPAEMSRKMQNAQKFFCFFCFDLLHFFFFLILILSFFRLLISTTWGISIFQENW